MVLHQQKNNKNATWESFLKRANDLDSMLEELFLITTLNYKKESRPSERIELGQYVRDFVEDHWLLIKQEV